MGRGNDPIEILPAEDGSGVGAALIAAFALWEWNGAKYPMVPKELFAGQRVVAVALAVAFVSGMNFYSMIAFAPLTYGTVFNPEYVIPYPD